MSDGHHDMALILGLLKLTCIVTLVVGIILGALLENQLSQNFRGLGFDDQIHSLIVLLITTGLFCGWTIVSIIGAMACRPRWTWVTGVLDMLFISIIAVNLPLLYALTSFTCDLDLGNGVCDFSTVMAGAYFTAMYVLSSLLFSLCRQVVFANMVFWILVLLPSSPESLQL
ncbi:unnamed protein product [Clonostachys byssicola]|uniref:Uncharacterized protein n=1 Tax=Clonostachys byssicola TaxID=160290 RepID=A0A9N9UX37_9HYPO|nr:unnamed protein product [Clonostachys byssicola]